MRGLGLKADFMAFCGRQLSEGTYNLAHQLASREGCL